MAHSICRVCGAKSPEYPTTDQAGCAATWHVYEHHPQQWRALFGDRPPLDPDPRKGTDAESPLEDLDPTPCCPDPECNGQPCTFPGYAANH